MFNVKKLLLAASLSSLTAFAVFSSGAALAAAPMAKTPAPGYFRLMLGAFEITPISDGTVELQVEKLLVQPVTTTNHALSKVFLMTPLETSVNAFVINTGTKLILIDAGAGSLFGPTLGKLTANLKAAGYEPSQIDDIFITHFHPDHIGGLVANGELVFPNAQIHAEQHDLDYWLSKANLDKAPADQKGMYQGAVASLTPYITAKKVVPFNGNTDFFPGLRAYAAYGHTVGHTVYEVESKEQKLLFIGDLIHVAGVQFEHPEVTIEFDTNQKEAAAARDKVFNEVAKQGGLIAGAHLQFPGLGHLQKDKKGFEWVPVNFTQMH